MSDPLPGSETSSLPHAVFLRRLAGTRERSVEARLGRAAFVALRLVDLLQEQAVPAAAFHYQHGATGRACQGFPADCTEAAHLTGVVASAADAFQTRDIRLLFPALFAYAHFLEDELRLEEALDVLDTLQRVTGEVLRADDQIAARLRTARVLRKLNRFDKAQAAYEEGRALAAAAGDRHSDLLSRIGQGYVVTARGNLPEAENRLRAVLADAETLGDREAQALAHQGVAVALTSGGQPLDAIPHLWQAFQRYQDDIQRARALTDLGGLLLIVGDTRAAERALTEAIRRGGNQDFTRNAMIELMSCASFRRDRVGFERWRERCEAAAELMPPNIHADFMLKAAIGWARFGLLDRAEKLLTDGLRLAEAAGLHEFTFRIERIKAGLNACDCKDRVDETSPSPPGTDVRWESVREVSASLARLEA
jgi:tetratricopeptide (TPR) repeat protein